MSNKLNSTTENSEKYIEPKIDEDSSVINDNETDDITDSSGDESQENDDLNENEDDETTIVSEHNEEKENEVCIYENNIVNKNDDIEEESGQDYEDLVEDDNNKNDDIITDPEERITKPFLYNYERVRLLSDRTKQLMMGAKPMIKNTEHMSSHEIALLELEKNMIPMFIQRPLPNGKKERWYIKELQH